MIPLKGNSKNIDRPDAVRKIGAFAGIGNNLKLSKYNTLRYESRDCGDWINGESDCRKITRNWLRSLRI